MKPSKEQMDDARARVDGAPADCVCGPRGLCAYHEEMARQQRGMMDSRFVRAGDLHGFADELVRDVLNGNEPKARPPMRRIDKEHRPANVHEAITRLQVALYAVAEAQHELAFSAQSGATVEKARAWLDAAVNAIVGS